MNNETSSLAALLQATRNLIAFHNECELNYPLSTTIKAFLEPAPPQAKPRPLPFSSSEAKQVLQTSPKRRDAAEQTIDDLINSVGICRRCPEREDFSEIIFGEGKAERGVRLLIILDPPGDEEKAKNCTIAGSSRELLVKMLSAINLSLEDIFLTNVIKCVLPSRQLASQEATSACVPFLLRQIELLNPKVICTMGPIASQTLLKSSQSLFGLRGRFHNFQGIPLIPTFHPSQLLKTPDLKKGAWQDLQMILLKINS